MGRLTKNEFESNFLQSIYTEARAGVDDLIKQSQSNSTTLTPTELLKSVTDSYASPAKLTLGGATLFNEITGGQAVAVGETKTFMARNGIKYFDSCNKVFINGTGINVTITNNTTATKDIMAIPMTGTPYENYTADQMNALVNTYFEGLKSTNKMEILTRGRNLFDGQITDGKYIDTISGTTILDNVSRSMSKNYIRIKPSTQYKLTNYITTATSWYVFYYDKNKNYISQQSNSTITSLLLSAPSNAYYLRWSVIIGAGNLNSIGAYLMLSEGTTALPYAPYVESKAKITCTDETKFTLAKLPNNVKNEILINDGKWRAIKRVERYVLKAEDISSVSTSLTNIDVGVVNLSNSVLLNGNTTVSNAVLVGGKREVSFATRDDLNTINNYFTLHSPNRIFFGFAKGTTLEQAKTALTGTVIYYELATPITIEEKDFSQYGIQVEGLLATNNAYTEFIVNDYDMLGDVGIEYSINLAKAIEELKDGQITEREFRVRQNLINLEFDARIKLLETPSTP